MSDEGLFLRSQASVYPGVGRERPQAQLQVFEVDGTLLEGPMVIVERGIYQEGSWRNVVMDSFIPAPFGHWWGARYIEYRIGLRALWCLLYMGTMEDTLSQTIQADT